MSIREVEIEEYWAAEVGKRGGFTYKFTVPGRRSVPDRCVMLPLLGTFFVELKRPGEKPTPAQKREHERIRAWGGEVQVIDSKFEVDNFFNQYDARAFSPTDRLH